MKIMNKEVEIPQISALSSEYVESELEKAGITPKNLLRWAIVKADGVKLTVNVAFCSKC